MTNKIQKIITNWNEVDRNEILMLPDEFLRMNIKTKIGLVTFYCIKEDVFNPLKQKYPNKWGLLYTGLISNDFICCHEFWLARLNNLHPLVKEFYVLREVK